MIRSLVLRGLGRLRRDRAGGVVLVFGAILAPLLGSIGLAVDASAWYAERARLQAVADMAAIASARELRVMSREPDEMVRLARERARAAIAADRLAPQDATIDASVLEDGSAVRIVIRSRLDGAFTALITDALARVEVSATARLSGSAPICVVGLSTSEARTISLENSAGLDARGCAVYSNSRDAKGLRIANFATMRAALICSAGGKEGPHAAFDPAPRTDCPTLADPLAARPAPEVGPCTVTGRLRITSDRTLAPGVYCGGLEIRNNARVTLGSGLYVIRDGTLEVDDGGALVGRYASFHFVGDEATFRFRRRSTVDLTAMRDGPLAGILFFEDRAAPAGRDFVIASDAAHNLLGTIYLPRGDLAVSSDRRVADRSAFTIIVARTIELSGAPVLVLNTDYDKTDIPVPEGVGPVGDVLLSQ